MTVSHGVPCRHLQKRAGGPPNKQTPLTPQLHITELPGFPCVWLLGCQCRVVRTKAWWETCLFAERSGTQMTGTYPANRAASCIMMTCTAKGKWWCALEKNASLSEQERATDRKRAVRTRYFDNRSVDSDQASWDLVTRYDCLFMRQIVMMDKKRLLFSQEI